MSIFEPKISVELVAGIRSIPVKDLEDFFDSLIAKKAIEVSETPNEDLTVIKGESKMLIELKNQFLAIRNNLLQSNI